VLGAEASSSCARELLRAPFGIASDLFASTLRCLAPVASIAAFGSHGA
jgi:hypothetical protein